MGGSGVQALVKNLDSGVKNHLGLRPPRCQVVKTPKFLVQRAWVPYLVEELRSHMLCDVAKKKKKKDLG